MRKVRKILIALALFAVFALLNLAISVPVRVTVGELIQVDSGYALWIGREYRYFRTREDAGIEVMRLQNSPRYVVGFKE